MKKYFLTFGGGSTNYYDAVKRICQQATECRCFDSINGYTDANLKSNKDFWTVHGNFITSNKRGYGYWLWKPYIILEMLQKIHDGDILLYADAGCEIDKSEIQYLEQAFTLVKSELILGTQTCKEKMWTKMDLILHMDMLNDTYLESAQRAGTVLLMLKCDKTFDFVKKWYELCCNYHFIDDSPSVNKNLPCFKEHRHDQSVLSLLMKKKWV